MDGSEVRERYGNALLTYSSNYMQVNYFRSLILGIWYYHASSLMISYFIHC